MLSAPRIVAILVRDLPVQVERQTRGPDASIIISDPICPDRVLSASADAQAAGVAAGMALQQARQAAPGALVLQPDEAEYHRRHEAASAALRAYTSAVETVALGEFLVDAHGLTANDVGLARELGAAVHAASTLAVQTGVARGRYPAQQAARLAAADSFQIVPPGNESRFLSPLPLTALPGLPGEALRRLHLLDIHTLGDFAELAKAAVMRQFGAEAYAPVIGWLHDLAGGRDSRPINPDVPPLRLARTFQLSDAVADLQILANIMGRLSERVSRALLQSGLEAESMTLAALATTGKTLQAGQAVKPPTADRSHLARLASQLLARLELADPVLVVTLSLYPLRHWTAGAQQIALVSLEAEARQRRLDESFELLTHRFGAGVIQPAAAVGAPAPFPLDIEAGPDGWPVRVEIAGESLGVVERDELWREERAWWASPVQRQYYRLMLDDGAYHVVFRDIMTGSWYLDRAWPQ